jgi:tetratricopeptide (TPR) repeat protein
MPHSKIRRFLVLLIGCAAVCSTSAWPQKKQTNSPSPVTAARAEISRGQLDVAEKTLWTVLSSDPNEPEALTLLGIVRGRQKRYTEAEALFRRVLQLTQNSLVAHRNLAEALIAQNKPDAALEEYKEVVKLAPHDYSAKLELAHLYLGRGEFADALSNLNSIPRDRLPPEALPAQAASLFGLGRREEAAALIPRAKQSPAIAAELAEVFLDANAPEYAIQLIDAALAGSQHPPSRLYYLKGRALQAMGNSSAALSNLQQALTREPKSVDTLIAIAALEASRNNHEKSLGLLKRAYVLQPDLPAVLRALVVEGMKAGQRKTALAAAQALADRNSDDLDDLYLAAAAMLEGQDFATASSIFEKYVSQRPGDSKAFLGLGIAQLAQQHYEEATKALERSLQIDPKLADAEYQLGILAEQKGATPEALQHFDRAVQLQPQHAKALASLGKQYLQAGDLEKAESALARSVSVDPNDFKTQYDLALVLSKLGKSEEARQHMERSRALKTAEDSGKNPASAVAKP